MKNLLELPIKSFKTKALTKSLNQGTSRFVWLLYSFLIFCDNEMISRTSVGARDAAAARAARRRTSER